MSLPRTQELLDRGVEMLSSMDAGRRAFARAKARALAEEAKKLPAWDDHRREQWLAHFLEEALREYTKHLILVVNMD